MMTQEHMSLKNVAHIKIHKHMSLNMFPQSVNTGKKAHLAEVLYFYFINRKLAALYPTLHESRNPTVAAEVPLMQIYGIGS